uniref:V-type proton ATPase subunit F n=1 Tax=Opuntia streptacantha TaxID=393608 RepID=A0A7C9DFK3_OPUST
MANKPQIPTKNSALIAMIADEDTITGFLLAGVGDVDIRRKTNYLIVDNKTTVKQIEDAFKDFTTREDIAIVMISQYCKVHSSATYIFGPGNFAVSNMDCKYDKISG